MTVPDTRNRCLCYFEASEVQTPHGHLAGLDLRGPDGSRLGRIRGVLIDGIQLKLRYLVIDATGGGGRCCLISPDSLIQLDAHPQSLRVESQALHPCADAEATRIAQSYDRGLVAASA